MAKIKLGNRPKNFKRVIKFPMLDGTTGAIEMTYKYRTRTEFGTFIDDMLEKAGGVKTDVADEKFSMAELMAKSADSNADYVLQVAEGWDVDAEFDKESIEQLGDEVPAAINAIMETYRTAITEGRLGN